MKPLHIVPILLLLILGTLRNAYISLDALQATDDPEQSALDRKSTTLKFVRQMYSESFAMLAQECTEASIKLDACIANLRNLTHLPWWFTSLLRDVKKGRGLEGNWHYMSANQPQVRVCTLEKVGSQQWRGIFMELNENSTGSRFRPGQGEEQASATSPNYVIVRDPLERLLSGYLNICSKKASPGQATHCEPKSLFNIHKYVDNEDAKQADGFEEGPARFARFVDTLPLLWNIHFMPQALFCNGLFRTLPDYDKKLVMGKPDFWKDLRSVQDEVGGRFKDAVENKFQVESHLNVTSTVEEETSNNPHITSAISKVKQFYTPRSVRRALEYFAADYLTLGLDIPDWVDEILLEEEI